jgi:hypothetical protein
MWTPQNDLERAALDYYNGLPAPMVFYRALLESSVVFLSPHHPENAGVHKFGTGLKLTFSGFLVGEEHMTVLFTSFARVEEALQGEKNWHQVYDVGVMPARNLLEGVAGQAIHPKLAINPGCECGIIILDAALVKAIVDGSALIVPTPDYVALDNLMLSPPMFMPERLRDPLQKYFATRPEVQAAWLMYEEKPAPPLEDVFLVWVLLVGGDMAEVEREAALAIAGACPPEWGSRAWVIKDPQDPEVVRIRSLIKPFYTAPG